MSIGLENKSRRFAFSRYGALMLFILATVVLEGALRKWVNPVLGSPLVLARDIAAGLFIALCLRDHKLKSNRIVQATAVWTIVVIAWSLLVNLVTQTPLWILALGLRFWLLYLWLAVCSSFALTRADMSILLRTIVSIGIIMTPLAIAQHYLPPGHILNSLPDTEEEAIFTISGDIVRTSGTFSFTLGYTCFLALFSTVGLSNYFAPRSMSFMGRLGIPAIAICILTSTIVSGSRASLAYLAAILVIACGGSFVAAVSKPIQYNKSSVLIWTLVLIIPSVFFFDRAVDAISDRLILANQVEDANSRFFNILVGEEADFDQFTLLGRGLGASTQAAAQLSGAGKVFLLAETEPGRVLLEGGMLGFVWILIKFATIGLGLFRSFGIIVNFRDTTPLLVWALAGYAFITWPITGQISAHAVAYVTLALALRSISEYDTHRAGKAEKF